MKIAIKFEDSDIEENNELCPECGAHLITKNSGVKCSICDYWFCF